MKIFIIVLFYTSLLFSNILTVKDSMVKVLINGKIKTLQVDQTMDLKEGTFVCFFSGEGRVLINDTEILDEVDECYQLPILNDFSLQKIGSLKNKKLIKTEVNSDNKVRSSENQEININNEINIDNKDTEVIIYNDTYGPLPVTLTIKNSDGTISKKFINEDNDKTLFRVPSLYLKNNSNIEVTNFFGDVQLKTRVKKENNKVFYKKKDHTIIEILYGTDRKESIKKDKKYFYETFYDAKRGELKWGLARVSVPKSHKFGKMERPSTLWGETEKKGKHILIKKLEELELSIFQKILKSKLDFVKEKDIIVFIHGYNNTFADAIRRTAQLTYDLKFKGVPITYSWPSQGNDRILTYMEDEASVQYTVPHLVKFLSQIIDKKDGSNIHILGHSMGTRALTNALKELSYIYRGKTIFKNIILAAPDIDKDVFKTSLLPYIKKTTDMITLYSSSDDKALLVSETLHGGERLGQSDNIFIFKGMNTIDATGIDTSSLGHSYFAEKEILLNDLKDVIYKSLPPEKRKKTLVEKIKDKSKYWKIKIKG